jgi:hypothetical protein
MNMGNTLKPQEKSLANLAMSPKKLILSVFFALVVLMGYYPYPSGPDFAQAATRSALASGSDAEFARAYQHRISNLQIEGQGTVVKVLPDDNVGSRHQRFLVRLNSGQMLLIAHNIDIAPRVASLKKNDLVRFSGQYKWNNKGGVLHWTHHDPRGSHASGWIEHQGHQYR